MSHPPICPCPNCKGSGPAVPAAAILTVAACAYVWHEIHAVAGQVSHAVELAAQAVLLVVLLTVVAAGILLARHLTRGRRRARHARLTVTQVPHVQARVRPQVQLHARRGRGEVTPPARLALSQGAGSLSSQVNGLPVTLAEDLSHVVIPGQVVSTNDE